MSVDLTGAAGDPGWHDRETARMRVEGSAGEEAVAAAPTTEGAVTPTISESSAPAGSADRPDWIDEMDEDMDLRAAMSVERDPVRALENVLAAARDYARFVIFKPDRPAADARQRLQASIAEYDDLVGAALSAAEREKQS